MEESLMIKDTKEFSDISFLHLYRSSVALGADSDVSIFINERKWIIYRVYIYKYTNTQCSRDQLLILETEY